MEKKIKEIENQITQNQSNLSDAIMFKMIVALIKDQTELINIQQKEISNINIRLILTFALVTMLLLKVMGII